MTAWDDLKTWTKETGIKFLELAYSSQDTPLIGNWCYSKLVDVYVYFMNVYMAEIEVGRWLDSAQTSLSQILSWDTIKSNVLGTWTYLNTIDDRIWSTAYSYITGTWSWVNDPVNFLWDGVRGKITGAWSWVNDPVNLLWDGFRSKLTGAWSWIDDPYTYLRDQIMAGARAAWPHLDDPVTYVWDRITPKLGGWILDWLLLNLTIWGKIGYRVLDKVWNMQWDEKAKEVK